MGKLNRNQMIIRHVMQNTTPEEDKDSMILAYDAGTKNPGVKEEKIYLDYANPDECRMKITNALEMKEFATELINRKSSLRLVEKLVSE